MNFVQASQKINLSKSYFELFGADQENAKTVFRELSMIVHEDKVSKSQKAIAHEVFIKLQGLWSKAEKAIEDGNYGKESTKLISKKESYEINIPAWTGDLCNLYRCGKKVVKIAFSPLANSFLENEVKALQLLNNSKNAEKVIDNHIPLLTDSFVVQNGKERLRVNVLDQVKTPLSTGCISLEDVIKFYPDGVELKTAAWMFRRLLSAIGGCHANDIVHGAVLPSHFLICPDNPDGTKRNDTHNGILIDFSYSVKRGETIKAISPKWKTFYPPEVLNKKEASRGTDVYMAAFCLKYLLGKQNIPKSVDGFVKACMIENVNRRPKEAFDLYNEFAELLKPIFGPPKFHAFVLPE